MVSIPVWEERTFPVRRAAVARLRIEIFWELSRDVRAGRWLGGGQPGDGEAGAVTQQLCCRVERLLAGETPESQLVASLAAREAVPDVTTEIGSEARSAPGLPRGGQVSAEHANAAEVISAALRWFK